MTEHSPEQDGFQEPSDLSENTGSDSGLEAAPADIFEPEDAQDRTPLARAFRQLREGRETTSLYQDIVKPRQTPVMAHIGRGIRYDEDGHHELAIDEFLAAKELDPDNVEVLAHLAAACGALGRFAEADREIGKAIRLDPVNVQARVCEAILTFERAFTPRQRNSSRGFASGTRQTGRRISTVVRP